MEYSLGQLGAGTRELTNSDRWTVTKDKGTSAPYPSKSLDSFCYVIPMNLTFQLNLTWATIKASFDQPTKQLEEYLVSAHVPSLKIVLLST